MNSSSSLETRLATLTWSEEGVLEVRFKEGIPADLAGIGEVVQARVRMTQRMKARVMVVLQPDMDFEIQVPTTPHGGTTADLTLAEATVAPTPMLEKIARMYYHYFPLPHPAEVFTTEAEARAWLLQHPAA